MQKRLKILGGFMGFVLAILVSLTLVNCGPRDDEKLMNGGGDRSRGFDIKAGQTEKVEAQNGKLKACSEEDDPTWDSSRLFPEMDFVFDKIDQFTVILGKGRTCVKVSDQDAMEIDLPNAEGRFPKEHDGGTGVFYYVTSLEMRNTDDFLKNTKLVKEVADGMKMSVAQLTGFINQEPRKPQIHLIYLKKTDGSSKPKPEQPKYTLPKGTMETVFGEGSKLSSCSSDNVWKSVRLPFALSGIYEKLEGVSVVLGKGAENCVQVSDSSTVELMTEKEEGTGKYDSTGLFYKVRKLQVLNSSDLLADQTLMQTVIDGMGLAEADLKVFLDAEPKKEVVTITYLEKSEEVKAPVVNPIMVYDVDGAMTVEACTRPDGSVMTWSDIRINSDVQEKMQEALDAQSLSVFLRDGDQACLPVGTVAPLKIRNAENKWEELAGVKVKVVKIVVRDKSAVIADPTLQEILAKKSGMNLGNFSSVLGDYKRDKVSVTHVEWVQ